jgi:hypothetical protein
MDQYKEIREVTKEFIFFVEGLEFTVKGRITYNSEAEPQLNYGWEISHYYKPSEEAAGVYRPSNMHGSSQEEAEASLKMYMRSFTTIGVTPNDYY